MRANVFHPRGAKCGTTSLAAWLSQHPEAFVSDPGRAPSF